MTGGDRRLDGLRRLLELGGRWPFGEGADHPGRRHLALTGPEPGDGLSRADPVVAAERSRRLLNSADTDVGSGVPVIGHNELFRFACRSVSSFEELDELLSQVAGSPASQRLVVVLDKLTPVSASR